MIGVIFMGIGISFLWVNPEFATERSKAIMHALTVLGASSILWAVFWPPGLPRVIANYLHRFGYD